MREEENRLCLAHRLFEDLEKEVHTVIPAATEIVFQLKWYCSTGVCPRGAHVRQRCGRWLSPLSSMKTMVRPSFLAFFLTPASASASTAESWLCRVPALGLSVAGNSYLAALHAARPA